MIIGHCVSLRSRLVAGAAIIALIASACGSDSSGGGTAESWCDFVAESDVVDEIFDSLGVDPAETESGLKQVEAFVKRLPNEAPPEIADEAKVIADGNQMLIDAFAAADYNIADVDLSFMADSDLEASLEDAGEGLDVYTQANCGRPFGDSDSSNGDVDASDDAADDDDSDFDPTNGTLRDQLIEQFESIGLTNDESSCIAANIDFADPAVQSGDIASMLDVFEECGIGLDRLAELGSG
jgi:hypothetical protein